MSHRGSKIGRQSIHDKAKYQKQFQRTKKNKEKKWIRHLEKYPNDLQAKEKIEKLNRM